MREKLVADGVVKKGDMFTFHDLKARGVTDHPKKHSGHKSKIALIYDFVLSLLDISI